MHAAHAIPECVPGYTIGQRVWDRLWAYQPSDEKDDRLLARERSSRRWHLIAERLTQAFGGMAGLRIVELGSGRGDVSALLAEQGAVVTLVDQSDAALQQAEYRFSRLGLQGTFLRGDMFAVAHSARDSFDVAVSSGVIEHFVGAERTQAVRAHFDAVRPGGLAIVSVPNACCVPYRLWKFYLESRGHWPYGIEIPYTRGELVRRARAAGFATAEVVGVEFRRSVEQLRRTFTTSRMSFVTKPSWLDSHLGLALVLLAWRDGDGTRT